MVLDKVLTIAIGRNSSQGPLKALDWTIFQQAVYSTVSRYATIVAAASGSGVGSDDNRFNEPEETYVVVAINPASKRKLRYDLAKLLKEYGQSSACFALDNSHRPAWSTASGRRK
jgi:hypothetical protein